MTKYHISAKTGKANICRATKQCPLGEKTPHFSTKEEAQDHIEAELKKESYSFKTMSRSSEAVIDRIMDIERDGGAWSVDSYLHEGLGDGYTVDRVIEGPDYLNQAHVEKDGAHFIVTVTGGEWSAYEVQNARRATLETKDQWKTKTALVETTKGNAAVNGLLREVAKYGASHNDGPIREGYISVGGSRDITITRKDGSKIHCFNVEAAGDRRLTDEPYPVETNVEFTENGEKQNARQMDRGFVMFDERDGVGVLLKYRAASEMGDQSGEFAFSGRELGPARENRWYDNAGDIYVLSGKEKATAEYFKYA